MTTNLVGRGLVVPGLLCAMALAGPAPPPAVSQFPVPPLRALTFPTGDGQVNGLVDAYTAMGEELIVQLERDPLSEDQQSYGYYLLGALRVSEAAPLLVERIDFEAKSFDSKVSLGRWSSRPAAEALIKLGCPAVGEILAQAQRPQSECRRKQMAIVLQAFYGKPLALEAVPAAVDRAETDIGKAHLGQLLEALHPTPE